MINVSGFLIAPLIGLTLLALILTVSANLFLIPFCHRRGILDVPGRHKRHKTPTPNVGGVSIFFALTITLAVAWLVVPEVYGTGGMPWKGIYLGGLLIFLVGLIDDARPLPAWVKLSAQALAGAALYWGGIIVDPLYVPLVGEVSTGGWAILINIFWVALLTNAVNLIDGLDGLATGVSLIAVISLGAISILLNVPSTLAISMALTGTLIGTLYFNLHPARIFLGDSGSLLIGYMFAVLSLLAPIKSFTTFALFPPLIALGAPLIETTVSFFRRLLSGKNVFKADRRHLFHYLSFLGLSPRGIVRSFWFVSLICGAGSIGMLFWEKALAVLTLTGLAVAVFTLFLILGLRLRRGSTNSDSER